MTQATPRPDVHENSSATADAAGDDRGQAQLEALASSNPLLRRRAARQLVEENTRLRAVNEQVRASIDELRVEHAKLTAPYNPVGILTDIERNGQTLALVSIEGQAPLRAQVHPTLNPAELTIGGSVYLTADRGCIVGTLPDRLAWDQVAPFEERLGQDRALLRMQEQLIPVTLTGELRELTLTRGDRIGFHASSRLALVRLPSPNGRHWFTEEVPEDDFAGLCGLELPIRQIRHALGFALAHRATAARFNLPRKRGILLDGPPGNGKTRLARCAAAFLRQQFPDRPCRFMSVIGSQDHSMWFGHSEENLRARFAAAAKAALEGPVLLFFDEFDALAKARGTDYSGGAADRVTNTLLGLFDDVQQTAENLVILAATNRAALLDPAVTRPGRFDLKLTIPAPNRRTAEAILRHYLTGRPVEGTTDLLVAPLMSRLFSPNSPFAELVTVKLSDGRQIVVPGRELISGAMLENVCARAAEAAAVREIETGRDDAVTGDDLLLALETELVAVARLLSPANAKAYLQRIPQDAHPVDVRTNSTATRAALPA
ncbi:MAG: AAA family ATPase [Pirellulales bacterium]|nr:AAA family ATPase [Pirellulales bacterium]